MRLGQNLQLPHMRHQLLAVLTKLTLVQIVHLRRIRDSYPLLTFCVHEVQIEPLLGE